MYNKRLVLLSIFVWLGHLAMAQQSGTGGRAPRDLAAEAHFRYSSNLLSQTHVTHGAESVTCGVESFGGQSSGPGDHPWFEADLGADRLLGSLQLTFDPADYPAGFGAFYVFMSAYPLEHTGPAALLSSPGVEHLYIDGPLNPQTVIPLGDRRARYLRVQSAIPTDFRISDVVIMGADAPGRSRAASPVFRSVVAVPPSCNDCHDGKIHVSAGGDDLALSLDGGATFRPIAAGGEAVAVAPGAYELVLRSSDGTRTVYAKNPVTVADNADALLVTRCGNGDFMNGFTGWTGWQGTNTNGPNGITNIVNVISAPRQQVLANSNFTDPNAPQVALASPTGQPQFARLGDLTIANNNAQSLIFTFLVTQQNYNFNFSHAAVLRRHSNLAINMNQEAFFSWTVTSANNAVIATGMFNSLNGTMQPVNGVGGASAWYFSNWQQECVNLIDFIGQNVTITFVSAGCTGAAHGGRAYIDGLCVPTGLARVPALRGPGSVCLGGDPATITLMYNTPFVPAYSSHFWTVERIDVNNQPIPGTSFNGPATPGNPGLLYDPIGLWSSLSGQLPVCGQRFRVTLNVVDLNCNVGTTSTIIAIDCVPATQYCDMAVCNGAPAQLQVQINGPVCGSCTFAWTPTTNVSNPNIALPQLANPGALGTTYSILVTSANGCTRTEQLEVWDAVLEGSLSVTHTCVDECSVRLEASFTTNKPFVPGRVALTALSGQHNLSFSFLSQTSLGGGYTRYTFASVPFENKGTGNNGATPEQFTVTISSITPPGFCNHGNCPSAISTTYQVARGLFHGIPNVYVPNIFSLSAQQPVNRYFNPFFSNGIAAPGVYWCEIKVFDRWGGLMYEKTSESLYTPSCSSTAGFLGTEPGLPYGNELDIFPWNGYLGNNKYTNDCGPLNNQSCKCDQGVYTYLIRYRNCQKDSNGNPITFQIGGDVLLLW